MSVFVRIQMKVWNILYLTLALKCNLINSASSCPNESLFSRLKHSKGDNYSQVRTSARLRTETITGSSRINDVDPILRGFNSLENPINYLPQTEARTVGGFLFFNHVLGDFVCVCFSLVKIKFHGCSIVAASNPVSSYLYTAISGAVLVITLINDNLRADYLYAFTRAYTLPLALGNRRY